VGEGTTGAIGKFGGWGKIFGGWGKIVIFLLLIVMLVKMNKIYYYTKLQIK